MKGVLLLLGTVLAVTLASGPLHVKVNRGLTGHTPLKQRKVQASGQRIAADNGPRGRLPNDVIPTLYTVQVTPILVEAGADNPQFLLNRIYGTVTIRVTAATAAASITLNVFNEFMDIKEYTITTPAADQGGDAAGAFETVTGVPSGTDEFVFTFTRAGAAASLAVGAFYDIAMTFETELHNDPDHLWGIYRSSFMTPAEEESVMATTQFEPLGAREAFPCFDEPQLKAKFIISIGHPAEYTAYGNTVGGTPIPDDPNIPKGWHLTTFGETPEVMSTYLVAFVVAKTADYRCVTATANPIPAPTPTVKACGPAHLALPDPEYPSGRNGGKYPADQSASIIKYFNDYTTMPYSFPKMDSVAIPDFMAGAMENWGLNTYRPEYLLYYGTETTESDRLGINEILSHELVHQWFGNTVTCEFWDQIWMNEGFADYFQYHGVNSLPDAVDFLPFEIRQYESTQYGLIYDASESTHPVINLSTGDSTFNDIMDGAFSPISYQKGATLLRMLEEFMTKDSFDAGIVVYLERRKNQPTKQDYLFEVLLEQAGVKEKLEENGYTTLKEIMDTWTLQSGFPLIRVSKVSDTQIFVSQERFKPTVVYSNDHTLNPNELWTVPLRFRTSTTPAEDRIEFIDKAVAVKSFTLENSTPTWVLVNPEGNAFYRVLYDTDLFNAVVKQLETAHTDFLAVARSQLFDDYFTFVAEGFTHMGNALELTKYLGAEATPVVWHSALYHLAGYLNKLIGPDQVYTDFRTYMSERLDTAIDLLGGMSLPSDELGAIAIVKSQLIDWACVLEMTDCLTYAQTQFETWRTSSPTAPIRVDVRSTVLCSAVAQDDTNDSFDFVIAKYEDAATTVEDDKYRYLDALACTKDAARISELFTYIDLDSDTVTIEAHRSYLLSSIAGNTVDGRSSAIGYFTDVANTENVIAAVSPAGVVDFYRTLDNFVLKQTEIDNLKRTAEETTSLADVLDVLLRSISTMTANVEWRTANEAYLAQWFASENSAH